MIRQSLYQNSYQGLRSSGQTKNFGSRFKVSCSGGALIPDPKIMNLMITRNNKFVTEIGNIKNKLRIPKVCS